MLSSFKPQSAKIRRGRQGYPQRALLSAQTSSANNIQHRTPFCRVHSLHPSHQERCYRVFSATQDGHLLGQGFWLRKAPTSGSSAISTSGESRILPRATSLKTSERSLCLVGVAKTLLQASQEHFDACHLEYKSLCRSISLVSGIQCFSPKYLGLKDIS
jgi:hypothetical protein